MDVEVAQRMFPVLLATNKWREAMASFTQKLISPDDLANTLGVKRNTIYKWRHVGKLPEGFLISPSHRRWTVDELVNHSSFLAKAFANGGSQ